jgi:hypothetical protein
MRDNKVKVQFFNFYRTIKDNNNKTCHEITYNQLYTNNFLAKVEIPGVNYVTKITIYASNNTQIGQLTQILPATTGEWYKNLSWSLASIDFGWHEITASVTDNLNQQSIIFFNVSINDPELKNKTTVSPTGILDTPYLLGINGYMTFYLKFNVSVIRPVKTSYIHIYLNNGTEVTKIDASNASQTKFNGTTVNFSFPIYFFKPGSYYVKFDEGPGVSSRANLYFCDPESTSITDLIIWTFTVPNSSL